MSFNCQTNTLRNKRVCGKVSLAFWSPFHVIDTTPNEAGKAVNIQVHLSPPTYPLETNLRLDNSTFPKHNVIQFTSYLRVPTSPGLSHESPFQNYVHHVHCMQISNCCTGPHLHQDSLETI